MVDVFAQSNRVIDPPLQLTVACGDLLDPLRLCEALHFGHVFVNLLDLLQRCLRPLVRIASVTADSL